MTLLPTWQTRRNDSAGRLPGPIRAPSGDYNDGLQSPFKVPALFWPWFGGNINPPDKRDLASRPSDPPPGIGPNDVRETARGRNPRDSGELGDKTGDDHMGTPAVSRPGGEANGLLTVESIIGPLSPGNDAPSSNGHEFSITTNTDTRLNMLTMVALAGLAVGGYMLLR